MEMNFCRRCGKPLRNTSGNAYECASGHTLFAEPPPSVGVFFVSSDNQKVLLTTRGIEPNKGKLDSPGGFLKLNESLEDAAARELKEELSVSPADYGPFTYLTSEPNEYIYQGEPIPDLTVFFWTKLKTDVPLQPADDVAEVNWYDLATVDFEQLSSEDIRGGVRALQILFSRKGDAK
jgi:NAD+ diphosphatase